MKKRKRIYIFSVVLIESIVIVISLFYASRARNFQFFGSIYSSIPNDDKKIALTFDDGPTKNTGSIIEKLQEFDITATFFVCGAEIAERPEDARAIVNAGYALGNHSYSHKRMVFKSYSFCKDEVDKTNELIRESGYDGEIFFRPPYCKKLFALPYYLNKIDMPSITWDNEPESVLRFDASPKETAQYIMDNVQSGSIILLHPMYEPKNTLLALDMIVPELHRQGYIFCTVAELYNEYERNAGTVVNQTN
ncbi:MAG: Bifunctional xylanase/deacetylase precursor [Firmicutes bacterium ADurb.Bin182]|nr:MAG: Bifunctional xylanase/deacetylase precursor [Firmicutes bacterium ADurb.Bin182]